MSFRLVVDEVFGRLAFAGGWGIDDLTVHRAVEPGASLSVELDLVETRPRTADRGDVDFRVRVLADGDLALSHSNNRNDVHTDRTTACGRVCIDVQ
ncbi:MAG: hypothetical protein ABEJ06_00690 [Haloarculaceae archaeon]